MNVTWDIQTPRGAAGAVAIVQLAGDSGEALDGTLERLGLPVLEVGRIARRRLLGVDEGLVIRWSRTCAHLMPHGGVAATRQVAIALYASGIRERRPIRAPDPMADYPEARSEVEARMLAALGEAASPRAIDLLLDQPRRWADIPSNSPGVTDAALDRIRNRLILPPLVVAVGPPNVGKSTLVNALAGRAVSITADQPGTTRDHVGVELDLGGIVVHYLDTPGLEAPGRASDPIQAEAQDTARHAAAGADLFLLCADASCPDPRPMLAWIDGRATALVVGLRGDLGLPPWPADVVLESLHEGGGAAGLERLVGLISETLVPAWAVADPRPWRFWA